MDQQNTPPQKGSNFYINVGKVAGWASAAAFILAFLYKMNLLPYFFSTPADLFQAALYLVLFAIFAAMAAVTQH